MAAINSSAEQFTHNSRLALAALNNQNHEEKVVIGLLGLIVAAVVCFAFAFLGR